MNIFEEAGKFYDNDNQLEQLEEKCMELAIAVKHFRKGHSTIKHVCEKIAAANIILLQMEHIFGMDDLSSTCEKELMRFKEQLAADKHTRHIEGGGNTA